MLLYNEWNMYCAPNIIPPSPQSTKINQRQACLNADLFFSALQRPAAGGEGCRSAYGATKSDHVQNPVLKIVNANK